MTHLELSQRLPELLLTRLNKITMASSVEGRSRSSTTTGVELAMAPAPP